MNYANMIEEKHLKKGFIVATLISTIIGTFTTSINLYERVRDRAHQHKKDHGQDEKIKELERRADEVDKTRRRAKRDKQKGTNNNNNGNYSLPPPPNGHYPGGPWPNRPHNDLRDALAASGPMIRHEYDRDYARLGAHFAEGDAISQNELQAHIIDLQASVIRLLQDALVSGTMPDPAALYAAAGRARNGSIRALQDQYQRMLAPAPLSGRETLRSSSVAAVVPSSRSVQRANDARDRLLNDDIDDHDRMDRGRRRRSLSQSNFTGRRAATFPIEPQPPLFCRFAIELQRDWRHSLDFRNSSGISSGSDRDDFVDGFVCPACMGRFAIEPDRSWKMHKPVVVGERVEDVVQRDNKPHLDSDDEAVFEIVDGVEGRVVVKADAVDDDGDGHGKRVTTHHRNVVELVVDRLFMLTNRFIVKCHRQAAFESVDIGAALLPPTYACCLCDRFDRSKVALCTTMAQLVDHVCEKHSATELVSDPDIRELRPHTRR